SLAASAGLIAFTVNRYKVSKPDEYLVRTGLGITDIKISKQGWQFPFQLYKFVKMQPTNYSFDLQAMSSEKLEFVLPGVFTIGPKDDPEALKKYVKLLLMDNESSAQIDTLIRGILEGEMRSRSAQMTIEQIFNDRKVFKELLTDGVQEELDQFGLKIYNANVQELKDSVGSEYFKHMKQKKRSQAENSAKVDISEAKKAGDTGEKAREAETRQKVAMFEADTVKL